MELTPVTKYHPVQQLSPSAPSRSGDHDAPTDSAPVGASPAGEGVGIEVMRRDHGVQVTRFVDLRTGAVIYQNPPEQVLSMVSAVIETIKKRERAA